MKSIREEATERAPYTEEDSWDRIKAAINARFSFEAGANYVLDAIEECFNPKDDIVTQWGAIATLVKQLKSNQ